MHILRKSIGINGMALMAERVAGPATTISGGARQ
jgi:hypothetical protein